MTTIPRWNALLWSRQILRSLILLAPVGFPVVCPSAVSTWARWEYSFSSDKSYASPAADVRLKVSYRGPNQETMNGLGLWDGDNALKIRCLFPSRRWTWQAACSDTNNAGLHQRSGSVEDAPYSGTNPLSAWLPARLRKPPLPDACRRHPFSLGGRHALVGPHERQHGGLADLPAGPARQEVHRVAGILRQRLGGGQKRAGKRRLSLARGWTA